MKDEFAAIIKETVGACLHHLAVPAMMSVDEVSEKLGISKETVRAYIKNGELEGFELGSRLMRIPVQSVNNLLEKVRVKTDPQTSEKPDVPEPAADTPAETIVTEPAADTPAETIVTEPAADAPAETIVTEPAADAPAETIVSEPAVDASAGSSAETEKQDDPIKQQEKDTGTYAEFKKNDTKTLSETDDKPETKTPDSGASPENRAEPDGTALGKNILPEDGSQGGKGVSEIHAKESPDLRPESSQCDAVSPKSGLRCILCKGHDGPHKCPKKKTE